MIAILYIILNFYVLSKAAIPHTCGGWEKKIGEKNGKFSSEAVRRYFFYIFLYLVKSYEKFFIDWYELKKY
jgi:hypothetical protein